MLGLPKTTELHKQLPKKAIYAKFQMNTAAKENIDADISRITIVNEISPAKVHIAAGKQVKTFFVVLVALKRKDFDEKNLITISKIIPQNMLLVLEHGEEVKLAIYHTKLMQTQWQTQNSFSIELKGLDLDAVWENMIVQIGGIEVEQGNSLDEQITIGDKRQKLEKEIARVERLARKEKQPKRKFEMVEKINKLKEELEDTYNG